MASLNTASLFMSLILGLEVPKVNPNNPEVMVLQNTKTQEILKKPKKKCRELT